MTKLTQSQYSYEYLPWKLSLSEVFGSLLYVYTSRGYELTNRCRATLLGIESMLHGWATGGLTRRDYSIAFSAIFFGLHLSICMENKICPPLTKISSNEIHPLISKICSIELLDFRLTAHIRSCYQSSIRI